MYRGGRPAKGWERLRGRGGVEVKVREEDGEEEKEEHRPSKRGRSQIGCDAS